MTEYLKSAASNNIDTTSRILCNADVVHPVGEQMKIVSTSNDDKKGGTGIRKIMINYFTSNWTYKTEIIALNGITPVYTVDTDIFRIEHIEAICAGSYKMAVGTITLKSIDDTRLFAQIDPDTTCFMRMLHYVRQGFICYIMQVLLSSITPEGVYFDFITTKDYTYSTSFEGIITMKRSRLAELKNNSIFMNLGNFLICDATNSSRPLGIAFCVKGSAISQSASASVTYKDCESTKSSTTSKSPTTSM